MKTDAPAIAFTLNGEPVRAAADPGERLSRALRDALGLTGTKVGCEHGVCGACTVQLDGQPLRSCLMLAAQADGRSLRTIEALGTEHPLARAFHEQHALQCGFCTAGFLMSIEPFLREHPHPDEGEIREALAGNLCRCTGYEGIVEAVEQAAREG